MDTKIPVERLMIVPIFISQVLTPLIIWQKRKLNMVSPLGETFKAKNQNTPDYESLFFYFVITIAMVFSIVIMGLLNNG